MLQQLGARLTYANVMSTIAVFVALGGSSYAAVKVGSRQIANNSVRSADLRNNDIRGVDIRKGAVRGSDIRNNDVSGADLRNDSVTRADIKAGTLSGAHLAPNSVDGRSIANLGAADFAPGQLPDPAPEVLPSRKTMRGVFAAAVTGGNGTSGIARGPVSFPMALPAEPSADYVSFDEVAPPQCPGTARDPRAQPGWLCLYEAGLTGTITGRGIFHPETGDNFTASRFGTITFINGAAGAGIRGTWAATAP